MNQDEWGLTERGFRRPTYGEILDSYEFKARELFGAKANLTVRSPLGMFLRIFSWMTNLLFSLVEDVYNSRFVDTAVGTSLYNLGRAIGMQLLPHQKAAGYLQITGAPGTVVPAGFLAATRAGKQYVVLADTQIGDGGTVNAAAQAYEAGPDGNTVENTVVEIVNPMLGIHSVNNPKEFSGGRLRETDEEFRDRYYKSVDYAGGVNADAIRGEILQNVPSVGSVNVYENDKDIPDFGLPPHSIEAVVYGGLDEDIAQCIYRRRAAGIQTFGNTCVQVISASNQAMDVYFSRPTPVTIWFRISGMILSDSFPQDGREQIRAAIVGYVGGSIDGGMGIGEAVYYKRIPSSIYSVPGVLDFDVEIGLDGEHWGEENILIGSREKAVTDNGKVVFA